MVWILLASLIWWDHPNLLNHLSFPYIKRDLSWKRLRLNRIRIGWGILLQLILERFISVNQVIVDLLHSRLEQVCVLEKRAIERGPYDIKTFDCNLHVYLIWYNNMFLSHKTILVLLYDSLITYIGSCWVNYIALTLVGFCSLADSISQKHWSGTWMAMARGSDI
jgi:hypothetical protein